MTNRILAGVPFPPELNLKVRSLRTGHIGKVLKAEKSSQYQPDDPDGMRTTVEWEHGGISHQRHSLFDQVEVLV